MDIVVVVIERVKRLRECGVGVDECFREGYKWDWDVEGGCGCDFLTGK
jgi:hypothetical protein